jgi:bacteriorhodopsin
LTYIGGPPLSTEDTAVIEAVIYALIYLALVVLAIYVVLWIIGELGITLPAQVIKIIWIIVALIALLIIVQTLLPSFPKLR